LARHVPGSPEATQDVATGVVNALNQYLPTISLPRLELAYASDGVPSIFGIRTTSIQALVPINLSFLNLPPAYVNGFTAQNLQHVELEVHPSGVFLYANGEPLPYLAWDEASLNHLGQMSAPTNIVAYDTIIRRALPLLRRLGIDLVLSFPRADGVAAIPLRLRNEVTLATAPETEPTMVVHLQVDYSDEGVPSIFGVSTRELEPLGVNLRFLELQPATLDDLESVDLQSLRLMVEGDGIFLLANGEALPHLAYSQQHLQNAVNLYTQLYGQGSVADFISGAMPLVQAMDIDVTLNLPSGQ
jgi:hypothetical protein